jgi:hypothetical protein
MKNSLIIVRVQIITLILILLCCTVIGATGAVTPIETEMADGGKAVIIFASSPLQAMTEIPFTIELKSKAGEMIEDAELALDLTMPFMPMPPNNPKAVWQDNAYRGTAIFTMAGAWQINVEVNHSESGTEKIIFDIEMVIMK